MDPSVIISNSQVDGSSREQDKKETLLIVTDSECRSAFKYDFPVCGIVNYIFGLSSNTIQSVYEGLRVLKQDWDQLEILDISNRIMKIAGAFDEKWMQQIFLALPMIPIVQLRNSELNRIRSNEEENEQQRKMQVPGTEKDRGWLRLKRFITKTKNEQRSYARSEMENSDFIVRIMFGQKKCLADAGYTTDDQIRFIYGDCYRSHGIREKKWPQADQMHCLDGINNCQDASRCMVVHRKAEMERYVNSIFTLMNEIDKIRIELPSVFDRYLKKEDFAEIAWIREALQDCQPDIVHSLDNNDEWYGEEQAERKKLNKLSKARPQTWICKTISGLVAAETFALGHQSSIPKKCRLCGKYFIPYSRRNVFCHSRNPEFGNQACNKIGPQLNWSKKLESSSVEKAYSKNRHSYQTWVNKRHLELDGYLESQKRLLRAQEYRIREKEIKEIKKELEQRLEEWQAYCKNVRDQVIQNKLREEDALDKIKAPSIKSRSEKYQAWKNDMREKDGLI